MEEVRNTKGITLVALIITIIILLILSVVTIRTVTGDGIIAHAKNAKNQYEQKAAEENALLSNLTGYITGQLGGSKPSGPALSEIKIGDKVAYDEGYRADKKSDVDTNFQMDDMEWRVLDVEANGTVKLISTKPTTSKLTLSGEDGWLNGPTKLDKICSDLYANGTGVTARSLKAEDINKLANYDPTTYSGYGSKWRYKYNPATGKIQYSTQNTNGTWTDYVDTSYTSFKDPRAAKAIDSEKYQEASGSPIIAELEYSFYNYSLMKIQGETEDNISIMNLITKGLNDENNASSSTLVNQWVSNHVIRCYEEGVYFGVLGIVAFFMNFTSSQWESNGNDGSVTWAVRPVVELSANTFSTEKVEGTWQVNI